MKIFEHKHKFFIVLLFLAISVSISSGKENNNPIKQQAIKYKADVKTERPWWLGDLITVLGITAGFLGVLWQLRRQHRNELKIHKENYKEQLRLQIYQEFQRILKKASHDNTEVGVYATLIATNQKIYIDRIKSRHIPAPLSARAIEFNEKHIDASKSIVSQAYPPPKSTAEYARLRLNHPTPESIMAYKKCHRLQGAQ
jgi:hypothetical protein